MRESWVAGRGSWVASLKSQVAGLVGNGNFDLQYEYRARAGRSQIPVVSARAVKVGDFRKLEVWKAGMSLVVSVYRCSSAFPRSEVYGLTSQMRRAAVSICANLAEGCGRRGDTELRRFTRISLGSATELESHLHLARELGYLDPAVFESLGTELYRVQAGLVQLIRSLSHPVTERVT